MPLTIVQGSVLNSRPNLNDTPSGYYCTVNPVEQSSTYKRIDISAGKCWDTTGTHWLEGPAYTKLGGSVWSGSDGGGLEEDLTCVNSSAGKYIYAMRRDTGANPIDYVMSLSPTWAGVNKPGPYTYGQLIGFAFYNRYVSTTESGTAGWAPMLWIDNYCQYGYGQRYHESSVGTGNKDFDGYVVTPAPVNSIVNHTVVASAFGSSTDTEYSIYARPGNYTGASSTGVTVSVDDKVFYQGHLRLFNGIREMGTNFQMALGSDQYISLAAIEYGGGSGAMTLSAYVNGFWMPNRLVATA